MPRSSPSELRQDKSDSARVLVVVPTLDEELHIEQTVETLLSEPPNDVELSLVVVDGGSRDRTLDIVRRLSARHAAVHLLRNPARIQSAAINLAARRFGQHADVLIRCDAHSIYPAGFCRRLLASLVRTGADAIVVPLDSVGESGLSRAIAWVSNSKIGTGGSAHRGGRASGFVDHGHHAAFRMDTFRRVGGYDETFTHNEDAEFDCRQHAAGAKVYLDGEIRVGYHPRATFSALFKQYFHYGTGRSRTARRHPRSLRLRQLAVPLHFVVTAALLLMSPWFRPVLCWPALYLFVLLATSLMFAMRRGSLAGLLTGPAAGVMHLAWAAGFLWGLGSRRERVWQRDMTTPLWSSPLPEDHA